MARISSIVAIQAHLDQIVAEALSRETRRLKMSAADDVERSEKLNAVRSRLMRWRDRAEADLTRAARQP